MKMTDKQKAMAEYLRENTVGFDKMPQKLQLYIIDHLLSGKEFNGDLMEFFDLPPEKRTKKPKLRQSTKKKTPEFPYSPFTGAPHKMK